jgi:phage baseplate assembly protein W
MNLPIPKTISWPLGGIDETGRLSFASDDRSIREVMLNILLTRPGERVMRADFGAGLLQFIHQPNNQTTRQLMADVTRKSLALWEPRAVVDDVQVRPDPQNVDEVHLTVHYRMRHDNRSSAFSLGIRLEGV